MTSASRKSSSARRERSPRFPKGVATSTNWPAVFVSSTLFPSFGSRRALPTNIVTYVEADQQAQTTRKKEGQPRQKAELRPRLTLQLSVPRTVPLRQKRREHRRSITDQAVHS